MAKCQVIVRQAGAIIHMQEVEEDLVPAILDHIEQHHEGEDISLSIVQAGWYR